MSRVGQCIGYARGNLLCLQRVVAIAGSLLVGGSAYATEPVLLLLTTNQQSYVDGEVMTVNAVAVSALEGEPAQDLLAVTTYGSPPLPVPLVQIDSTSWQFVSGQLRSDVDASVHVSIYLESSVLSNEWRNVLGHLNQQVSQLTIQRDSATDPVVRASLQVQIDRLNELKTSILQILTQDQLPLASASLTPVVMPDGESPIISGLMVRDHASATLLDGAVTESQSLKVSWQVADNVSAGAAISLDGSLKSFAQVGDHWESQIDIQTIAEGAHILRITATDLSQNQSAQTFAFTVDRVSPLLAISEPSDCYVEKLTSTVLVRGTVQEPNLNQLRIVVSNSLFPNGVDVTVDIVGSGFQALVPLEIGDNLIRVEALDSLSHGVGRSIRVSRIPSGAPTVFSILGLNQDEDPVPVELFVNSISHTLPAQFSAVETDLQRFDVSGIEGPLFFQTNFDPQRSYFYDISQKTLSSIQDGCGRFLKLLYPSGGEKGVDVELAAMRADGSQLAATFTANGKAVSNSLAHLPKRVSASLQMRFGGTTSTLNLQGGLNAGETKVYDVATGVLQTFATPGFTRLHYLVKPIVVRMKNLDTQGGLLGLAQDLPAADGGEFRAIGDFKGFSKETGLIVQSGHSYELSTRGGGLFIRGLDSGLGFDAGVTVAHELQNVRFDAALNLAPLSDATLTIAGGDTWVLPRVEQVGMGSGANVSLNWHGFSAPFNVRAEENTEVQINVADGSRRRVSLTGRPSLAWDLIGRSVQVSAEDACGGAVSATVGIKGAGSGTLTPAQFEGADGMVGTVFGQYLGRYRETPINVGPGVSHRIDVTTGAIRSWKMKDTLTSVRFIFPCEKGMR